MLEGGCKAATVILEFQNVALLQLPVHVCLCGPLWSLDHTQYILDVCASFPLPCLYFAVFSIVVYAPRVGLQPPGNYVDIEVFHHLFYFLLVAIM